MPGTLKSSLAVREGGLERLTEPFEEDCDTLVPLKYAVFKSRALLTHVYQRGLQKSPRSYQHQYTSLHRQTLLLVK